MKTFIFKIYRTKNSKEHFIVDLSEGQTESEAAEKLKNRIYYFDSNRSKILGTCKKAELINIIS